MNPLLQRISDYIKISKEEETLIETLFIKTMIKKDHCLVMEGSVCSKVSFIQSGLLKYTVINNGKEEIIHFSTDSEFVCDFESFISRKPSRKYIVALEESILFSISYKNLQKFYSAVLYGERFGRLLIEELFVKTVSHIISRHSDTPKQRYINFVKSFNHIQQRIPQYYIASFVGVTPESLSRIRRRITQS